MNIEKIRRDFPILSVMHNGHQLAYLDNAASSQRPNQVIDAMSNYYKNSHANIHRGVHFLGEVATDAYEGARMKVANFVNAGSDRNIIFTKNVTESINLVAHSFCSSMMESGDVILTTKMEHHSNLVPWQMAADRFGLELRFIDIDDEGKLVMDGVEELFADGKIKMLAVTHVSNVLGTINDVKKLTKIAQSYGAHTLIDAAQSAAHMKLDVQDIDADFVVFTGHKMCGPTGIGVLCGRTTLLETMPPFLGGGGMVEQVEPEHFSTAELPEKFEAGTPPIAQAVGLSAAIDYLEGIDMEKIHEREKMLSGLILREFEKLNFVRVFGPQDAESRIGVISFEVDGVHPHDVSEVLSNEAICVRVGHHCAHTLMAFLSVPATTRVSAYFYNTEEEIMRFIAAVKKSYELFN